MTEKRLGMLFRNWINWNMLTRLPFTRHNGSEFDVVILVVPQASSMLLTRNLLYTGMTRAKKMLIVIGNRNLIEMMVRNFDIKKRNTGLKDKLADLEPPE